MADASPFPQPFNRLSDWYAHLRDHGFDLSLQRQTNVGHWLWQRVAQGDIDWSERQWLAQLAPLLCRTGDEQRRYQQLLTQWPEAGRDDGANPQAVGAGATTGTDVDSVRLPRARWPLAVAVLAAIGLSWLITTYNPDYCNDIAPEGLCQAIHPRRDDVIQPALPKTLPPAQTGTGWTQVAQPLPIITQPGLGAITSFEQIGERRWLAVLMALLPFAVSAALCLWFWRRRTDILQRAAGDDHEHRQRDALRLAAPDALFDSTASDTAMRALNQPVHSASLRGRLNTVESLSETARLARPQVVFQPIARLPEVILLVQVAGIHDLREELAARLGKRLVQNGARVSTYLFTASPTWVLRPGASSGERLTPVSLRLRHPNARVLLLSEAAQVYNLYGSQLRDWARVLADWQAPLAVMTPEPFDVSLTRHLRRDGLQLLPLDETGLGLLAKPQHLARNLVGPLPLTLQSEDWSSDPATSRRRYQQLAGFMGDCGMRLLQVLALYPELHLGLAVALDQGLFPNSDRPSRQRRLSRLLRLPWARQGWLPDRLRLSLLESQSAAERNQASGLYRQLFESLGASGHLHLPFDHPDRWTALRLFLGLRGPGEHDLLFLSQVVGPRWLNRLAFYLPQTGRLLARLGRFYGLIMALILLLSTLPALWLFQHPDLGLAAAVEETVPLKIDLRYTSARKSRADAIADWLARSGATVERTEMDGVEPGTRLHVRPRRDPLARLLAEHLRRMPEPDAVQVRLDGTVADSIVVEVGPAATQGQGVAVYRDHFTIATESAGLPDTTLPEMVRIPGGAFMMGSPTGEAGRSGDEGPLHRVKIAAFELSKAEITFAQYAPFARETGRAIPADVGWGRGERPLINVSWDEAVAYIDWLNEKTGDNYRLPTEAEWEYAARAGTTAAYALPAPQGSDDIQGRNLANCNGCGSQWDNRQTAPVGSFAPNPWGLLDMHGNVWEWVQDCWHDSYEGAPVDGSAWLEADGGDCNRRVLRGGGWNIEPANLRAAFRGWSNRGSSDGFVGFRLARTRSPSDL